MKYLKTKFNLFLTESIQTVDDFYNKLVKELDKIYFPNVKYYRDDKNNEKVHYTIELFNNGILTYDELIERLSLQCNDSKENIHNIVKKYISDFGDYKFDKHYQGDVAIQNLLKKVLGDEFISNQEEILDRVYTTLGMRNVEWAVDDIIEEYPKLKDYKDEFIKAAKKEGYVD